MWVHICNMCACIMPEEDIGSFATELQGVVS